MTLIVNTNPFLSAGSQTISVSQIVTMQASGANAAHVYLSACDISGYTVDATTQTGFFTGNGNVLRLQDNPYSLNSREAGIVFDYDATTGHYANATYGNLMDVTYTSTASAGDVTDIYLCQTTYLASTFYAANVSLLMQYLSADYDGGSYANHGLLGSTTVVTTGRTGAATTPEANATPQSIAAIAQSFVGERWDANGCWVLSSTISALAGASLTVSSAIVGSSLASGGWYSAYNGASGADANWQNLLRTGDMVTFTTNGHTDHITTVADGAGIYSRLIDNANYGSNSFNDGSNDLTIVPLQDAYRQFDGVDARTVTIFRLDTPTTRALSPSVALGTDNVLEVSTQFSATSDTAKVLTKYEIRLGNGSDVLQAGGRLVTADATGTYTVASLADVKMFEQEVTGSDSISVRAYNGTYWGDWVSSSITPNSIGSAVVTAADPYVMPIIHQPAPMVTPFVIVMPQDPAPVMISPLVVSPQVEPTYVQPTAPAVELSPAQPPAIAPVPNGPTPLPEGCGTVFSATLGDVTTFGTDPDTSIRMFRFFDAGTGTQFLTSSVSEANALVAARPDLRLEGHGMGIVDADPNDANVISVNRFFNTKDGAHFFTQSDDETRQIQATRQDLVLEASKFHEHVQAVAGDQAVYRFFDSNNGNHFFTQNAGEYKDIVATRPDLISEGVAFYAPTY